MPKYDCIVVGAGPAGASALRDLALAGVRACAVDKASFPRYKPCGGAISALTASQLDFPWEDLVEASLHHVELAYRYGPPLHLKSDRPFARFVMRDRFDQRLLEAAQEAGGDFYPEHNVTDVAVDETGVTVRTGRGDFRAPYVIGADGANGVVARAIGLFHQERGIAMEAEVSAPPDVLEAYSGRVYISYADPPWGYGWIFPKAQKLSVGVGTFSRRRGPIKESFHHFLEKTGLSPYPMEIFGHPIPTGGTHNPVWAPRVLLTGDAAGLNDPLSGEGIAHAVRSGKIAARHVADALGSGRVDFPEYQEEIRREIVDDLARAAWIANKLYTFPKVFFWLFTKSPGTAELYFRLVRGEATYADVTDELLKQFLRFDLFAGERR